MRVFDATFLIDYGRGVDATAEYLREYPDERFVVPAPVLTEFLLGAVHGRGTTDLAKFESELSWADVVGLDRETARSAAVIADEIDPQGPQLTAIDAVVAAVARDHGGTVVSVDTDLTHDAVRRVVDVDEYR